MLSIKYKYTKYKYDVMRIVAMTILEEVLCEVETRA
jgi:hypothetical protein